MLLAVDAGNTNLVFALVEDGAIRARWRIATDARRTADEYAGWLTPLLGLARSRERHKGVRHRRHHLHGVAARSAQSRSAHLQIFRRAAFGRGRGAGRMG